MVAGQNSQTCTLVKSKPIKLIPVNISPTQSCLMTLLKANTPNQRAIKCESFMKRSQSAQRRMYTQRDQIRCRCPACAACIQTRALVHSCSHTHKHGVLCWCDKSWTSCNGRSSMCQDTGRDHTYPLHALQTVGMSASRSLCDLWLQARHHRQSQSFFMQC